MDQYRDFQPLNPASRIRSRKRSMRAPSDDTSRLFMSSCTLRVTYLPKPSPSAESRSRRGSARLRL